VQQSPPSESNNHSASQKIPRLLGYPKVHYCIRKARHWPLFWITSISIFNRRSRLKQSVQVRSPV